MDPIKTKAQLSSENSHGLSPQKRKARGMFAQDEPSTELSVLQGPPLQQRLDSITPPPKRHNSIYNSKGTLYF